VAWDIPLTEGYEFELVPNVSRRPGTHHFFGLRTPALIERVTAWRPDAVHVTGWAWHSHLQALRAFHKAGVPILFRGDSHLLDSPQSGLRWLAKRSVLKRVYSWPTAFLFVGKANRQYYEAFGVKPDRLYWCPHSIDVCRFVENAEAFDREAAEWRQQLGIADGRRVLLFAGKFERKKQPVELMRAVLSQRDSNTVLVMVGGGEYEEEMKAIVAADPGRFRILPFQNQSRMPVVYRLADLFILPSAYGETWGLAVNEAIACGVPALLSDRVGCAPDVIDDSCGRVFPAGDVSAMMRAVHDLTADAKKLSEMGVSAAQRAWAFDVACTESALMDCLFSVLSR
jgi:glycosyltransferase involved in cell wall biosynthesis